MAALEPGMRSLSIHEASPVEEAPAPEKAPEEAVPECDCSVPCNGPCGQTRRTCCCKDIGWIDKFCARCKTREEVVHNWCTWSREFPIVCLPCCLEIQNILSEMELFGSTREEAERKWLPLGPQRRQEYIRQYEALFHKPFAKNTSGANLRARGGASFFRLPPSKPKPCPAGKSHGNT